MFHIERAEYFEAEDPQVRAAPSVSFDTGAGGATPS
jgi:hypothetical protein